MIDNLLVAPASGGTTGPMGGATGVFSLRGRCLLVDTDGTPRTPIFAGRTRVDARGIHIAMRDVAFGERVSLPGIGAPLEVPALRGTDCPAQALTIRAIE